MAKKPSSPDESEPNEPNGSGPPDHTDFSLGYAGPSRLVTDQGNPRLQLFGNLHRDAIFLDGVIRDPLALREALGALHAVVASDYRYVPKDRTAYHAYRRMKQQSANLGAWQAQQAYFDWLSRNDPLAYLILDPVITVHPDAVFWEVFSKDEGTYANVSIDLSAFDLAEKPIFGTTNIDFSDALHQSLQQCRSYRQTRITIGTDAVKFSTQGQQDVLEKRIKVPDSWLRGFLQVQSASMLPTDTFQLTAMDLYNILRHLRFHADIKGQRRGMRIELMPGEKPRVVLEPWETVIPTHAEVYKGRQAKVVRLWGRRRLMLIRRLLPFLQSIEVHVTGSGLPSFWVLRAGPITFTLGMTGFTASNWSQAVNFDLMMPRQTQTSTELEEVLQQLSKTWTSDRTSLADSTKLQGADLIEPLQRGCQQGQIMYDLAQSVYRFRPITQTPLDFHRLEYRNDRERRAYDWANRKGAMSITSENRLAGVGLELVGKAVVAEDKREYRPKLLLTDEGFVSKAECTCNTFRQQGLKAGPCTCLIALRLTYAMRERQRRQSGKARQSITTETRSFSRRQEHLEDVVQISLNKDRLKVRWGQAGQHWRVQHLQFDTIDAARAEYFARTQKLEQTGYLDASM